MPQNSQGDQQVGWFLQNGPNILYSFFEAWAVSVQVFFRSRYGVKYLQNRIGLVLFLVPCFGLFWRGHDLRPLYWYLLAYWIVASLNQAAAYRAYRRGEHCHSRYNGWPRFMKTFSSWNQRTVKQYVEPLCVLAISAAVSLFNQPLAVYLFFAAICLFISEGEIDRRTQRQATEMHDAVLEQEIIVERFRDMRGD